MKLPRFAFPGTVTSCIAFGVACGGTIATGESASTTGTGGGAHASGSAVTSTAGTGGSAGGAPDAGPDAAHGTLCHQVPCVPPEGGACGGCMMSCGPLTSTCASDPSCECVMAHGNEFCPGNAQALTCTGNGGEVTVLCGPCI
jgi:hypothetical protein